MHNCVDSFSLFCVLSTIDAPLNPVANRELSAFDCKFRSMISHLVTYIKFGSGTPKYDNNNFGFSSTI